MKIEKGIPMPEKTHSGRQGKYPFRKLEVGESFFVDGEKEGWRAYGAARQMNYRTFKNNGLLFEARREGKGYRIWRTR